MKNDKKKKTKELTVKEVLELLQEAADHLNYCGYDNAWERKCVKELKLQERIERILEVGKAV